MHDPFRVGRGQGGRDLFGNIEYFPYGQRPAGDPLAQCLAVDEFSGDEEPIAGFSDFMNRKNIRMI